VRVERTDAGMNRRPPVLKTGMITGPHALPRAGAPTPHSIPRPEASPSDGVPFGRVPGACARGEGLAGNGTQCNTCGKNPMKHNQLVALMAAIIFSQGKVSYRDAVVQAHHLLREAGVGE